jgi:hypothetical protein
MMDGVLTKCKLGNLTAREYEKQFYQGDGRRGNADDSWGVETGLDAARNDGWNVVAMETATDSLS